MTKSRIELGKTGEKLACKELMRTGYKIVAQNYRCSIGEIDIIAEEGETLVFVEIKTRNRTEPSIVKEAITPTKQRKIAKVALTYIKNNGLMDKMARFDVVAISINGNESHIEIIKNAFDSEI